MIGRLATIAAVAAALLSPPARAAEEEAEGLGPESCRPALGAVRPSAGLPASCLDAEAKLYGVDTYRAPDRTRRYRDAFLRAELEGALVVSPQWSVESVLKFEPVATGTLDGTDRAFRDEAAFAESLYVRWQPVRRFEMHAGKFTAPFGIGHREFPGIRLDLLAEDAYEITESLGIGAGLVAVEDPRLGRHTIGAALFTLDTSFLSSTFVTRKRYGRDEADRFARNTRAQGGPGNDGRLDNFAVALEGRDIGALPGLAYQVGVLSRGAGRDGTARETGLAAGATWRIGWTENLRTILFAEAVLFRNAGGRPVEEVDGTPRPVSERHRLATLGARTESGPFHAVIGWQRDERQRAANGVPGENYLELSAGVDLPAGFGIDLGWSRQRTAQPDGRAGVERALLGLVSWKASL